MSNNEDPSPPQKAQKTPRRELHKTIREQAEAIDHLQREVAQMSQDQRRTLSDLKNLQAKRDNKDSESESEEAPPRKRKNTEPSKDNKTAIHIGKKITLCFQMWTEPAALELLTPASDDDDSNVDEEDENNTDSTNVDEQARRDAELIKSVCPSNIISQLNYAQTRRQIKEGQRTMRTATVDAVLGVATAVFDVDSQDFPALEFGDKKKRITLAKVQELLKNKLFLYDNPPTSARVRLDGYMRGPCILRILRVALYGKSSVLTGRPASKARATNGRLMCVREVTLPMLAFAATIAYFVLTSASELSEAGSDECQFGRFYRDQLRKLENSKKTATGRARIGRLVGDFNKDLFPAEGATEEMDEEAQDMQVFEDALAEEAALEEEEREAEEAAAREKRLRADKENGEAGEQQDEGEAGDE